MPPYSPPLNPIEKDFSLLKTRYHSKRPKAKTKKEITIYVTEIIKNINEDPHLNIKNYFNHMRTFVKKAIDRDIF